MEIHYIISPKREKKKECPNTQAQQNAANKSLRLRREERKKKT